MYVALISSTDIVHILASIRLSKVDTSRL